MIPLNEVFKYKWPTAGVILANIPDRDRSS
jgi:hypothetical protein